MDTILYSIEVTADIATKIRQFAELGVFAQRSGSVEIHFDVKGNIALVVTHTQQRVIPNQKIDEIDVKSVIV